MDLSERIVTVIGPEDLVITVGQQLSWICAACRGSRGTLSYGHVLFHEVDIPSDPSAIPIFKINTEIVGVDTNESRSCWCAFLLGSVIVTGFPIRPRLSNEAGLEIPLEIMSALGGILDATEFGGGYILKGRSTMFVPIKRLGDCAIAFPEEGSREDQLQKCLNTLPNPPYAGRIWRKGLTFN